MARPRTTLLTILVLGLLIVGGAQPLLAQQGGAIQVPASAIVRGEDIRLRFDPATESQDITIMQRGDEITITGPAVAADGEEFYPITLSSTGEAGWIRTIFINPLSITPLEGAAPVAPVAEPVTEPTLEVVPVPVEETTDERPRRDRNADEEQAPAEEEQGERRNRNRDQQPQDEAEVPVEEVDPELIEEVPVIDQPIEQPPADEAPPAEPPPADSGENGEVAEPAPGTISISGEGTTAADPQAFEAQRYRVRALVEASAAGSFRVELLGPDNFSEVLVDDTIDQPQTWISRTAVTIETPGDYVVQVSGTDDPWVVEFLPR